MGRRAYVDQNCSTMMIVLFYLWCFARALRYDLLFAAIQTPNVCTDACRNLCREVGEPAMRVKQLVGTAKIASRLAQ